MLAPKQAAAKLHLSNKSSPSFLASCCFRFIHLDQPNKALTSVQLVLPTQDAPAGHTAHFQFDGETLVSFKYSLSKQSSFDFHPKLIHDDSPVTSCFQPRGHARQKVEGDCSCGW